MSKPALLCAALLWPAAFVSAQNPAPGAPPTAASAAPAAPVSPEEAYVPFDIKAAIMLSAGHLYENRETVIIGQTAVLLPFGAMELLRNHRVHTAMA